ncbi:hypothetical protein LCGC14_0884670 [marine sediment metagenome]|uniref:Uncharacterized protein n=1 Tax=marine sediment metagenome TaxID=412755 RepID=A0A0F9P0X1_9ZZZZ
MMEDKKENSQKWVRGITYLWAFPMGFIIILAMLFHLFG